MTIPVKERSTDRIRPAYRFYHLAWAGLDLLYPPQCGGCSKPGARWCSKCQRDSPLVGLPLCDCCGVHWAAGRLCLDCQTERPAFDAVRSWGYFEGVLRHAIHQLKYYGDLALGEALARPMIDLYSGLPWNVDLVVPVPLGVARRAERGYNQASLLAWPIALSCGLAYRPKALRRWRDTPSQVGLDMLERRKNLIDAFQARPDLVDGKAVMLVDDVTTTGATMQACALALRKAGASRIYGLTLARTAYQPAQI